MNSDSKVNNEVWDLKCSICGHNYRVGEDATIVTMEDVYYMGSGGVIFGSASPPVRKDLVASMIEWQSERLKDGQQEAKETFNLFVRR